MVFSGRAATGGGAASRSTSSAAAAATGDDDLHAFYNHQIHYIHPQKHSNITAYVQSLHVTKSSTLSSDFVLLAYFTCRP